MHLSVKMVIFPQFLTLVHIYSVTENMDGMMHHLQTSKNGVKRSPTPSLEFKTVVWKQISSKIMMNQEVCLVFFLTMPRIPQVLRCSEQSVFFSVEFLLSIRGRKSVCKMQSGTLLTNIMTSVPQISIILPEMPGSPIKKPLKHAAG